MYKIIGADGREYGPVSIEALREWISQGRANAKTKVRREDSAEWVELGSMPEFSSGFGPGPQAGVPHTGTAVLPPAPGQFYDQAAADAMAQEVFERNYWFDISRCLSRAWDLLVANFWLSIGAGALTLAMIAALLSVPFGSLALGYVVVGGLNWLFLKMVRVQRFEFGDMFAGFNIAFIQLMLFSIVSQLLVNVGFLLCILPGIYLVVAWLSFTGLLIMDKKLEFWPAMELSRKVTTRHWWHMFGFVLLCLLINLLGVLVCVVGVFFTFPLTTIATVYAYEEIFSRVNPPSRTAPVSPLPVAPAG